MIKTQRENWLDVAKGIGIILILVDHSQNFLSDYVSWFHLSIFFVISGYLFKSLNDVSTLKRWIKKRTLTLLVPYFSFLLVITVYRYIIEILKGNYGIAWFIKDFVAKVYGGQYLTGEYAPFWFITCLLGTQIVFALITTLIKSKKLQIVIIVLFYILAHIESSLLHTKTDMFYVPLAADVILIAIVYYAFGFYFKKILSNISLRVQLLLLVISCTLVLLQATNVLEFKYELKYVEYSNLILDFTIPISFTILILGISQALTKLKTLTSVLSTLGIASLTIMYLHFPLNLFIKNFIEYPSIIFILIGLIIPLFLEKLVLEKNYTLRFFFLGKSNKKPLLKTADNSNVKPII